MGTRWRPDREAAGHTAPRLRTERKMDAGAMLAFCLIRPGTPYHEMVIPHSQWLFLPHFHLSGDSLLDISRLVFSWGFLSSIELTRLTVRPGSLLTWSYFKRMQFERSSAVLGRSCYVCQLCVQEGNCLPKA